MSQHKDFKPASDTNNNSVSGVSSANAYASTLDTAQQILLSPTDLNQDALSKVLHGAMSPSVDSADLYLQHHEGESWSLENGIIRNASHHMDQGFGLRVITGETTGFAYGNDLNLGALQNAAQAAQSISHHGGVVPDLGVHNSQSGGYYPSMNPFTTLTSQEKVAWLQAMDREIRARDPRIKEVIISLSADYDVVWMLQSSGEMATDVRPMVSLHINVIAEQGGVRGSGRSGAGARCGYEFLRDPERQQFLIDKAVNQALLELESRPAPAGEFPVVLGAGWPAVLFHEAVGHGLEADFNRKRTSVFTDRIGEKVASSGVTIVDDGTMSQRRGSVNVDDEGVPGQENILIEDGILRAYMQDRLNAKLMGVEPTGNGRRESYAHQPLPRMTNTYLKPGKDKLEDMIKSVKSGLYAVDFAGGQVDITSGTFVFSASEAYWIEDGKISYPVKGATLIGNGPAVMQRISMIGSDLKMDSGIGVCGKSGQSLPVGVGQPSLKIDKMTIGGASE